MIKILSAVPEPASWQPAAALSYGHIRHRPGSPLLLWAVLSPPPSSSPDQIVPPDAAYSHTPGEFCHSAWSDHVHPVCWFPAPAQSLPETYPDTARLRKRFSDALSVILHRNHTTLSVHIFYPSLYQPPLSQHNHSDRFLNRFSLLQKGKGVKCFFLTPLTFRFMTEISVLLYKVSQGNRMATMVSLQIENTICIYPSLTRTEGYP